MEIEKIHIDVTDPRNSSFVYKGFTEYILKREGFKRTDRLMYNKVLDDYLKENYDKNIENKRTVISDYLNDTNNYDVMPMLFKNTVIGLHYKKKNPKVRLFTKDNIKNLSSEKKMPLLVNLNYLNFKHDPNPQVLVMYYETEYNLVSGFNLHYLTLSETIRLVKLCIKFPNCDMQWFYFSVIKPLSIQKATGMKLAEVRKVIAPYRTYPDGFKRAVKHFKGIKYKAHDTEGERKALSILDQSNNMLTAYRRYKINKAVFYNVPVELFNLRDEG